MHECYAMQILEIEKKKKNNEQRSQRIAMKHKDHVRKTQLN